MWTTLVSLAALSLTVGQADGLNLTNVRNTYGVSGPTRADSKILPGDTVCLSFDIEGMQIDAKGKVKYSIGMEVANEKGKVLFRQLPSDLEADVAAGSKTVPACAKIQVGTHQPPGDYTLKVTVTDRAAGASREISRTYQLLPKGFGLVQLTTTADRHGATPVAALTKGKPAWINFAAVGFGRDKDKGQPHVHVVMKVLDEEKQPVLREPASGAINKDVPAEENALSMQFELRLHRTGKFTVELKATDKITGEEAVLTFPITATDAK
jgi:hypothetical protein